MAAVPIYVWNGTAWQETGPVIPASPIKYQASAPSSPSTGDIWVDSDGDVTTGSQQFQRFRFVASGGETSISGVDANGATLAYTAGTEIVALNGSTLVRGQDYTATNGTSITGLSPALVANDVVEVFSFMAFNVANTYTQSQVDGLVSDAPGLKLIVPTSVTGGTVGATGAITFSSVSSLSVNSFITSTYNKYKIYLDVTNSTLAQCYFRFRTGTTDKASEYYGAGFKSNYAGATGSNQAKNNGTEGWVCQIATSAAFVDFDLYKASGTTAGIKGLSSDQYDAQVIMFAYWNNGLTSSVDGFTIYPSSGTMSGTLRIYGYKN